MDCFSSFSAHPKNSGSMSLHNTIQKGIGNKCRNIGTNIESTGGSLKECITSQSLDNTYKNILVQTMNDGHPVNY